jgi:hypothetical protein
MRSGKSTTTPSPDSNEIALQMGRMLRDEPVVRQGLRILQTHCLAGGLSLRFGAQARALPTPTFSRHVERYYVEFCRQAIEAFMTVGFVAYRIRRLENGAQIPEPMPLGTYSWYVTRGGEHAVSPWMVAPLDGRMPPPPSADEKKERGEEEEEAPHPPLLRYEVHTAYCKETVYHHVFVPPHPLFTCMAPLMGVLHTYMGLLHKRACVARADAFNSQPSVVLEQQEKHRINELVATGQPIVNVPSVEMRGRRAGDKDSAGGRQEMHYQLLEEFRTYSHLPEDSVTMIAPTNHTVHSLERVTTPLDMAMAELGFVRRVASALGLPENLLLQGAQVVGGGASGGTPGWSDSAERGNRQLLDMCRDLNRHLERALTGAYERIYGVSARQHEPIFRLMTVPTTFALEQLLQVWNARLIDDESFSAILNATWGAPLGREAVAARLEQRKAEFDLPFRDKKDTKKK